MIIAFHFMSSIVKQGGSWSEYWIVAPMGSIGVSFFIIISGAGIYIGSLNWSGATNFYRKRIKNIYPTFWFVYLFMTCFLFVFANRVYVGPDPVKWIITILGFDGYMSWYTSTYYIIGEWFLGFIIIIYALFPLVKVMLDKSKAITLILSVIVSVLIYMNNKVISNAIPIFNASPEWNPLVRLPEFIFGAIIASLIMNKSKIIAYLTPVALVYIIISLSTFDNLDKGFFSIPSLCSLFVLITVSINKLGVKENIRFIVYFFSANSFVAFLVHHKVIGVLGMYVKVNPVNAPAVYIYMISVMLIVFTIAYFLSIPLKNINKIFAK